LTGEEFRALREELGLTQKQVAREAGCARSYISAIERGVCRPNLFLVEMLISMKEARGGVKPTGCEIARLSLNGFSGLQFCGFCNENLPESCEGLCDPSRGRFKGCPVALSCPCAYPASEERWAAFFSWTSRVLSKEERAKIMRKLGYDERVGALRHDRGALGRDKGAGA